MQTNNFIPVNARIRLVNGHTTIHGRLSDFSDKDDDGSFGTNSST